MSDAQKRHAVTKEFLDLMPLTLALAGLPQSELGKYFSEEQIETRLLSCVMRIKRHVRWHVNWSSIGIDQSACPASPGAVILRGDSPSANQLFGAQIGDCGFIIDVPHIDSPRRSVDRFYRPSRPSPEIWFPLHRPARPSPPCRTTIA